MRRWAVGIEWPINSCYDIVYDDDPAEIIEVGLSFSEARDIVAAHNAEVDSLPTRDEIADVDEEDTDE